jgi:hypothetical protein
MTDETNEERSARYVRCLVVEPCSITQAAVSWLQSDHPNRDRLIAGFRARWPECVAAAEILAGAA